ncbi:MAG: ABATE domain-containing protein [Solirubrobacterales bacterium]|nr:ABATE domain-containing protein [Solirubrobacterales bacterium]MBV9797154.1 ABATE domain-containing protein [Solirubrobacterales bacterium]
MSKSQAANGTSRTEPGYPLPWVWKFPFRSGRLCLDFVSTLGSRRSLELERLASPSDLRRWAHEAGIAEPQRVDRADLARALKLREAIYALLTDGPLDRSEAVATINLAAGHPPLVPQLDISGQQSTWVPTAGINQVLSTIARDAIDVLSGPIRARVKECAGADCTILFLDTSRPGTRRWCSMEVCGNQIKSAVLRAKRKAAHSSSVKRSNSGSTAHGRIAKPSGQARPYGE